MKIGRKIYFEKLTGNIILDTGEREGAVVETTFEQDFAMYTALQRYVPEQVGVIQFEYGQDADKFGVYYYRVDPETNTIIWGDKINPDMPDPQPTIKERIIDIQNTLDILLLKQEGII